MRSSLEEVAKRASEGAIRPEVRIWAIEILDKARKSGKQVNNAKARADAILRACQAKLWVPDPLFAEYIPAAHLLACDEHGEHGTVCAKGDDCDGLVVLCAAALMSVGLYVMIVGHAYSEQRTIQHVLCAVRIGNKWLYADPSTPEDMAAFPLGQCMTFTRERLLSCPNINTICDADVCLTTPQRFDPERLNFVTHGEFVGVNGVVEVDPAIVPFEQRIRWLGAQEIVVPARGQVRVLRDGADDVVVSAEEKKGWDTTEKFMAAGLVLSVIGLAYEVFWRKK